MTYDPRDNLVPLLGGPRGAYRLIQGRMTAWNAGTLASTVLVNGEARVDLPILDDAIAAMGVDITVLLAPLGTGHIILGKIRVP